MENHPSFKRLRSIKSDDHKPMAAGDSMSLELIKNMSEFERIIHHVDFKRLLDLACRVKAAWLALHRKRPNLLDSAPSPLQIDNMLSLIINTTAKKGFYERSAGTLVIGRGICRCTDSFVDEAIACLSNQLTRAREVALSKSAAPPNKAVKGQAIVVKYSKRQTDILNQWMVQNKHHPFPNSEEIHQLCNDTQLSYTQVVNWTTNVRKRNLKAVVENGKKPHHFLDFLFLAEDRDRKHGLCIAEHDDSTQPTKVVRDKKSKTKPDDDFVKSSMKNDCDARLFNLQVEHTKRNNKECHDKNYQANSQMSGVNSNFQTAAKVNFRQAPPVNPPGITIYPGIEGIFPPRINSFLENYQRAFTHNYHREVPRLHHHPLGSEGVFHAHDGQQSNFQKMTGDKLKRGGETMTINSTAEVTARNLLAAKTKSAWPVTPGSVREETNPTGMCVKQTQAQMLPWLCKTGRLNSISDSFGSAESIEKLCVESQQLFKPEENIFKKGNGLRMSPIATPTTSRDDEGEDYWEMIVERDTPENILNIFVAKSEPTGEKASNTFCAVKTETDQSDQIDEKLSDEEKIMVMSIDLDHEKRDSINWLLTTNTHDQSRLFHEMSCEFDVEDLDSSLHDDEFDYPPQIDIFPGDQHADI